MEDYQEMKKLAALTVIIIVVILSSCSSRRTEPFEGPLVTSDSSVIRGEIAFVQYCNKCHPFGEAGLGPALNINPAPKFIKAFQVRHGLGVMPSFKKDEIGENELKDILEYLKKLKRKG